MLTHKVQQAGDTIVEVLVAISVISLVLVGAYISTNHNISSVQDAQERSQAVKLVATQIEYLRRASSVTNGDCLTATGEKPNAGLQGVNPCIVTSDGSTALATQQPAYTLSITTSANPGVYAISAKWDSLLNPGKDNVTMYYHP